MLLTCVLQNVTKPMFIQEAFLAQQPHQIMMEITIAAALLEKVCHISKVNTTMAKRTEIG